MTPAEELVLVEAALADRYSGKAVEEWSEAGQRMRYVPYKDLAARLDQLRQTAAGGGATNFGQAAFLPRT